MVYKFTVNGVRVKVVFSEKAEAVTLENALVKIATAR